jgi:phage tail-like protein
MVATLEHARPNRWLQIVVALVLSIGVAQGRVSAAAQAELAKYTFTVQIEGKSLGGFRQVSGLKVETEVVEFRDGSGTTYFLPGNTKYSPVKLSRAFTGDSALWDWYTTSARAGHVARVSGFVSVMDATGHEVARFTFQHAWVQKYEGPSLNADSNDVPIESIELVHEGLTLTTSGRDPSP